MLGSPLSVYTATVAPGAFSIIFVSCSLLKDIEPLPSMITTPPVPRMTLSKILICGSVIIRCIRRGRIPILEATRLLPKLPFDNTGIGINSMFSFCQFATRCVAVEVVIPLYGFPSSLPLSVGLIPLLECTPAPSLDSPSSPSSPSSLPRALRSLASSRSLRAFSFSSANCSGDLSQRRSIHSAIRSVWRNPKGNRPLRSSIKVEARLPYLSDFFISFTARLDISRSIGPQSRLCLRIPFRNNLLEAVPAVAIAICTAPAQSSVAPSRSPSAISPPSARSFFTSNPAF